MPVRLIFNSILILSLCFAQVALGKDIGGSIGAGGILFEPSENIALDYESLRISPKSVLVKYQFRNEASTTESVEIGFPLPRYSFNPLRSALPKFHDLKIWVDGNELAPEHEVRCLLKKEKSKSVDIGPELKMIFTSDLIDIDAIAKEAEHLSPKEQADLLKRGWFTSENGAMIPQWDNVVLFHWHQEFPPKKSIWIKQQYSPQAGVAPKFGDCLAPEQEKLACLDSASGKAVKRMAAKKSHSAGKCSWVDYVLSTAPYWKGPIKSFDLVVEKENPKTVFSTCFEGIKKSRAREFKSHRANFIPDKDVRVYFFDRE
jgi:hypothetical protein